ncbi:MAG: polysaccharide export protein [Gemmatimonadetes bacterium]|nr:polysaccharide export protein [Gemmatimonadota bacterium]
MLNGKRVRVLALVPLLLLGVLAEGLAGQSTNRETRLLRPDELVISPGDLLTIRVWPETNLGGEYPVEASGVVYLPMLGGVQAGGETVEAFRGQLRERFAETMRSPVVSVTLLFRVSVVGAVRGPGLYMVDPTQTLFDVISRAGGFMDEARQDDLRLIRDGKVIEVNARRALETGEALLAVSLRSGDRVVVPRKSRVTINAIYQLLQAAAIMVTLITVLRTN